LLPLWDVLGTALGFGTALLGKKATALCTSAVEEVIGGHYGEQIDILSKDYKEEKELKEKFIKFREEELEHKNTAESLGANNDGLYSILDIVIKNSSKLAIAISKKYHSTNMGEFATLSYVTRATSRYYILPASNSPSRSWYYMIKS
jgi:ubiquinone biosynthesis monooxygenase Coq7